MCNQLFNMTKGKLDEFDYVKKIFVEGIVKLSTEGESSSSMKKPCSISRFSPIVHPRGVEVGNS